MQGDSKKPLVVVTGGSRGLGLAVVRHLADQGFRVVASSRQTSPELDALAAAGKAFFEPLDLADHATHHDFVRRVQERHGPWYGLVNNGAMGHDGILATMPESQIEELVSVNLTGAIVLAKYAVRSMLINGMHAGRVVNVASVVASTGYNGLSVYAATKAGLIGFTRSLAREVGRAGITVNAVSPGFMETRMTSSLDSAKRETILRRSPLSRLATVDEVAAMIAYLLSPAAASVTGANFTVDAGASA